VSRGEILLLGDPATGERLAERFPDGRLVRPEDPYDGLLEMSRRRWPVVLIATPQVDFPGLCRASRRLQGRARLLGLCSTSEEPFLRPLVGAALDDYFVRPLLAADIAKIGAAAGWRSAVIGAAAAPGAAGGLSVEELTGLIESTRGGDALEGALAELVGSHLAVPVSWTAAQETGPGQVLLSLPERGRVLRAQGPVELDEAARAMLASLTAYLPALVAAARRTESLHQLAITDHLTGAFNRRYFYEATDRILSLVAAKGSHASLLLYDIDDFKSYNDTYGHAAGDEILRATAALMKQITRRHDIVARIGGDEFAVLFWDAQEPRLPGSRPLESAYDLAQRFLSAVRSHRFPSLGPDAVGKLTISGGLADFPADGQTCRELLRSADQALRAAKASGKGAIRFVGYEIPNGNGQA